MWNNSVARQRVNVDRRTVGEPSAAVKSADRALIVLEYLAVESAPHNLAEIADALDIPRSSLHGLLRTMQSRGWLSIDDGDGGLRYRIGPQALTVGASYLLSDNIVRRSNEVLDALLNMLDETIHLGVLENMEVMYLAKRDASHSLRLVSGIGVRLPAYATALGKVLLAELDEESLSRRLASPRTALTSKTLIVESVLRQDLIATRARGYAVDDEESTEGVRCFAVALGGSSPRRYAISCSVPIVRLNEDVERRIVDALKRSAAEFAEPEGIGAFAR